MCTLSKGYLIIEAIDAATRRLVWRGSAGA